MTTAASTGPATGHKLVSSVRAQRTRASGVDALMHEFSLSSEEGVALMCLAEALLRIPDNATADRLIADKISKGDWRKHLGESPSLFVNAATWGLLITGKLVDQQRSGPRLGADQADFQRRRAADPQRRGPGDAHAGQPVRDRPDHR
jgi:proline dehydrogenase